MRRSVAVFCILVLVLISSLTLSSFVFAQMNIKMFEGMKARSIGPAGMSGRIGSIDAVVSNPNIIYVGAATGGLWRSVNGGVTWKPLFDEQAVPGIGAVAVFQKNPSIVWAGTGEGNPRNSVGVGKGIYKSLDGGDSWKFLGLAKTEKIHRVVLNPDNPDVAFAGALGTTWGENPERGVFKTVDGGKTWKKVLYVNEKTGCADLVMDPSNPNKLFASMWEHRRWPWFFNSGGPGSGLYVTYDGGDSWKKLTDKDGMPKGNMGRIGVAVAKNNPNVVYALVEAKKNALLRSENGGRNWKTINNKPGVNSRPFYYADIRVDPENENRVFCLQSSLKMSEDAGKNFNVISRGVHLDHHALWINPQNGSHMIDGNDGGIAISLDRGKTWRFVENLPLAQFYHINIDMAIPFNVYGGMQDNGSWRGPSEVWQRGGIRNYHWEEVGFGDGFACLVDPLDPNFGYAMSQGGYLNRFNLATGERKNIYPHGPDDVMLRFNWNAAIAIDPFDHKTVYYGSQFVHKSPDRGDSWKVISPDLTTDDPKKQKQHISGGLTMDATNAENHCSIITIAPSSLQKGLIWAGTDDGNVQITTDGGATWKNVVKNIPDLAENAWCPHIEASRYDAGTAYVVFDDHRRSNWITYVYKTEDYGKSWKSLTKNPPELKAENGEWGFVHVIEQDPVKKDLLYLGTEFGLFISFDDGGHWMKWTNGVPTCPVRALIVHPRDHALVIGSHGRAAFILDDVTPFRTITEETTKKPLHMFEIAPAYQHRNKAVGGYHFSANAIFQGENRRYGALVTYIVNPPEKKKVKKTEEGNKKRKKLKTEKKMGVGSDVPKEMKKMKGSKNIEVTVLDEAGKVIRKTETTFKKGMNRYFWNLRRDGYNYPGYRRRNLKYLPAGPEVVPGIYTIKFTLGDFSVSQKVEVKADPRENFSLEERKEKQNLLLKFGQRINVINEVLNRVGNFTKSMNSVLANLKEREDDGAKDVKKSGGELNKKLEKFKESIIGVRGKQGIHSRNFTLMSKVGKASGPLNSTFGAPTPSGLEFVRQAEAAIEQMLVRFNKLFDEDVAAFKEKVKSAEVKLFKDYKSLDMNWEKKKH